MECPNCAAVMKLVPAGVSKMSGKPYGAFFSCPECKATANPPVEHTPPPKPVVKTNGNSVSTDMMRLAYRKDLMVALINQGLLAEIEDTFKKLWGEIENG